MKEKNLEKFGNPENCPVRNVVDKFGDKWSLLILMILDEGNVLRFNEIYGYIKTISQKMLSVTLKNLEANGFVKRTIYPQIPPKVEYELTPLGKSLIPHLNGLIDWAHNNMGEIQETRRIFKSSTSSST